MSRKKFVFDQLYQFLKTDDIASMSYILRWEYQKQQLFQIKNDEGLTLLHIACLDGNLRYVDLLLEHGASVHTKSSVGWTSLHAATLGGNFNVVSYLLHNCSADPLAKDDMGCIPSDLTMDRDILQLLNEHTDNEIAKRDMEALASTTNLNDRRRSHTCDEECENQDTILMPRTQSLLLNKTEAVQIRVQYVKTNEGEYHGIDSNLLAPHDSLQRTGSNLLKSHSLNEKLLQTSIAEESLSPFQEIVKFKSESDADACAAQVENDAPKTENENKRKGKKVLKLKKHKRNTKTKSLNRTMLSVERSTNLSSAEATFWSENVTACMDRNSLSETVDINESDSLNLVSELQELKSETKYLDLDETDSNDLDAKESMVKNTESFSSGISSAGSEYAIKDLKERHNNTVMQRKISTSAQSTDSLSPPPPRAVKFFTLERTRRKKEAKNRDSGVFDDDLESDTVGEGAKSNRTSLDHYKLI